MLSVKLVTYQGDYKTLEVDSINLPTPQGRRGILPNHMPIMLPIDIGVMYVKINGQQQRYTVSKGVFYFENNEATLLADTIEDVDEIDVDRAEIAKSKAEERLKSASKEIDIRRAEIALAKAVNRINAAKK